MFRRSLLFLLIAGMTVSALFLFTSSNAATAAQQRVVRVAAEWSGVEEAVFRQALNAFTARTGIQVQFETLRPIIELLPTRIAAGNEPDVAVLPQPGFMAELARAGEAKPLAFINRAQLEASYAQTWIDLGTVDGNLVGIFFKAANKSTIFYRPDVVSRIFGEAPFDSWVEMITVFERNLAARPPITPLAFGGQDGWTLTDWLENIFVNVWGAEAYNAWARLEIGWTDPRVRAAVQFLQQLFSRNDFIAGGRTGALGTGFIDAALLLFRAPPQAAFYYEGDFMNGIIADQTGLTPGVDYSLFPFPKINPLFAGSIVGGGDVAVMLNDTPEAREFMNFLITREAAEAVVRGTEGGSFTSPNRLVDLSLYPDPNAQLAAKALVQATAFVFDASDLMPGTLGSGLLFTELQSLLADPSDASLDRILNNLENCRQRLLANPNATC